MGITHVIRGDDHLNNAFRQTMVYRGMDWDVPEFAHIPLIHGVDGPNSQNAMARLASTSTAIKAFLPPRWSIICSALAGAMAMMR